MPEAFAVLLVGIVSVGIFIYAKIQALSPEPNRLANERIRLAQEIAWLEDRLLKADREGWHDHMKEPLEGRLADARLQAAALARR